MDNNYVHLIGTVKRDATQGDGVMDFAVEVPNEKGTIQIFDCRLTERSDAWGKLDGFVSEGELIEVIGHLEKRTNTDGARVSGVWVEVRNTTTVIYVDDAITED